MFASGEFAEARAWSLRLATKVGTGDLAPEHQAKDFELHFGNHAESHTRLTFDKSLPDHSTEG